MIDSAGLLALMLSWARARDGSIKRAPPNHRIQHLLKFTNPASVFEIHPPLEDAGFAFRGQLE
jgi:hypothetical protein